MLGMYNQNDLVLNLNKIGGKDYLWNKNELIAFLTGGFITGEKC